MVVQDSVASGYGVKDDQSKYANLEDKILVTIEAGDGGNDGGDKAATMKDI